MEKYRWIIIPRNRQSDHSVWARKMGVTSFPTLFLEINGKHYDLKGSAITLNDLEENLNIIKEKGGILNDGDDTPVACNIDGTGC